MEEAPGKQALLQRLADEPENWEVRTQAAEMLSFEGRLGEAVAILDAAPAPPEFERHVLKATEVYNKLDPTKAVPMLHTFLQENPHSAMVHMAMAETASKLGDFHGAGLYYNCAVKINPALRDPDFEEQFNVTLEEPEDLDAAKTMTIPVKAKPEAYDGPVTSPPPPSSPVVTGQPSQVQTNAPTERVELPTAEDGLDAEDDVAPVELTTAVDLSPATSGATANTTDPTEPAPTKSTGRKRRSTATNPGVNWLVTSLVALGVVIVGWLIVLLVVEGMFAR